MPAGDRTGPMGQGPRSGRAMGYCSGNDEPGYSYGSGARGMRQGAGRGFRNRQFFNSSFRGRGMGLRFSNQDSSNQASSSNLEEMKEYIEDLKNQVTLLEKDLKNISQEKSENGMDGE